MADELLPDDSDLVGKIGIANAKLAYREYQKIFASDLNDNTRFFSLNTIGAQPSVRSGHPPASRIPNTRRRSTSTVCSAPIP